jgi:hypothetical protein
LNTGPGRTENAIDDRFENFGIPKKEQSDQRRNKSQQKKNDPK